MTNRELSSEVRSKLKEAGFTSKDYSIRVRDAGYSTSVDISVKNPKVRVSEVITVAKQFESVERDERTGEILQGGNVFVHCQYESDEMFDEVIEPLMATAEKVFSSSQWDGKKIAENDGIYVHLCKLSDAEKSLHQYGRDGKRQEGRCIVKSPKSLALAIWRLKNIGTIFA